MIAWFARHQTAANLLMAAIMLLGLVALPGLQRETLPEIKSDTVQIRVIYRGGFFWRVSRLARQSAVVSKMYSRASPIWMKCVVKPAKAWVRPRQSCAKARR